MVYVNVGQIATHLRVRLSAKLLPGHVYKHYRVVFYAYVPYVQKYTHFLRSLSPKKSGVSGHLSTHKFVSLLLNLFPKHSYTHIFAPVATII